MTYAMLILMVVCVLAIWWFNRHPDKKRRLQDELDKAVKNAKDEIKKP